jgi:glyoxylase-like metal-dependent hydrolase (beta-lactamase superfamily II)
MSMQSTAAAARPPSDPSPRYLQDRPIEHATLKEVAPGVHWVRMPLPIASLEHINLWVLEDGDDFVIVDTGFAVSRTHDYWDAIFSGPLSGRRANRLICTHFHNDHASTTGWIMARMGCDFYMTQGEYLSAAAAFGSHVIDRREQTVELLRANGLDPDIAGRSHDMRTVFSRDILDFPRAYNRLFGGDTLQIGGRSWEIILGYGHSPEHAALYCADIGVLISGDMVLPRITTNISVQAMEPDANPLQWFLDSIVRHAQLPADTLVLPSHGLPFRGLRERVAYLRNHHRDRLNEVVQACAVPKTAADILPLLFRRPLTERETRIAMGEAMAHMHLLYHEGRLKRARDEDDIVRYRRA